MRVAKTIEKGKKVNALSEELYLQWEMKYRGSRKKEVDAEVKKQVQNHYYELARGLLSDGLSVDALEKRMKIPRDDLLRMQAELNGTPA